MCGGGTVRVKLYKGNVVIGGLCLCGGGTVRVKLYKGNVMVGGQGGGGGTAAGEGARRGEGCVCVEWGASEAHAGLRSACVWSGGLVSVCVCVCGVGG